MRKIFIIPTILFFILSLCSCTENNELQTAEHTYSQLGFSVSYKFPKGYSAVSSDDDPDVCIYAEDIQNKLDWSILMSVRDMNYLDFEDYKGEAAKTASDIKQKDDIWTFIYKEPQERIVMLRWFEYGKLLILRKANDFEYDNAFEIAKTFEIDIWGNDIR